MENFILLTAMIGILLIIFGVSELVVKIVIQRYKRKHKYFDWKV